MNIEESTASQANSDGKLGFIQNTQTGSLPLSAQNLTPNRIKTQQNTQYCETIRAKIQENTSTYRCSKGLSKQHLCCSGNKTNK